jgi:ATP-dependent protease HslVU (ClpYQ) peptidase subunit
MSQARGFGGMPSGGHWATAAAQASWTASSAISRSPVLRVTLATAAHQCSRSAASSSLLLIVPFAGIRPVRPVA